jgi:tRNA 5-methylaminomethyl-2-thiouridine biosynthesis bifunctional protein
MVVPAVIEWDADGTPYAPRFGDVYHARAGALGQARHVFLQGNRLAERWRPSTGARRGFAILETGFGLGTNFLATWDAWRAAAAPPAPLRYVGIELHPPLRADFERMHAASPLGPLAEELAARWPAPVAGLHRIDLDEGKVTLLLVHSDAAAAIERLWKLEVPPVDAYFLDGFSPARNPEVWSAALMSRLACLAAPDATAATWSSARRVRDALAAAGFVVQRVPGYAGKREMTVARRTAQPSTGQQAE